MRLFNSDHLESEQFPCHITMATVRSTNEIPKHSHEFVEFVFVAEGEALHHYNEHTLPITKGDLFIMDPDAVHTYEVPDDKVLRVYNVMFEDSLLRDQFVSLSHITPFVNFFYVEPFLREKLHFQSSMRLDPQACIDVELRLERMLSEYRNKELGYRIVIITALIELFTYLSRWHERLMQHPAAQQIDEEQLFQRIGEYITINHAKPLTLQTVSRMCDMSPSSFTSKFKSYFGKTFIEYRNEVRIHVAMELLTRSTDKIITVANIVGFDDISFFNKVFKQTTGKTPKEYRDAYAAEQQS